MPDMSRREPHHVVRLGARGPPWSALGVARSRVWTGFGAPRDRIPLIAHDELAPRAIRAGLAPAAVAAQPDLS